MDSYKLPQKEEIINTINLIEDIDNEIKENILNLINTKFKILLNLKRFNITSLKTKRNRNTEFAGFKIRLNQKKPITVIKGSTGTGKTTIFDKIWHFFSEYHRDRSKIKNLLTELELVLEDKDQGISYTINFHSQYGFNNKSKFKILEQKLIDKSIASSSKVVSNPEGFLKQHLLLDYNLNETIFIPEISDYSFVARFCINENDFRTLLRIPILNIIFDEILKIEKNLKPEIENVKEFLFDYQKDLENKKYYINALKENIKKNDFLIDNEKELIEASKEFERVDNKLKRKNEEKNRKIRSLRINLKNLHKDLDELNEYNIKNLDDQFDVLYQSESRYCWNCNSIIHRRIFKKRVEQNLCYICGIGSKSYEEEFQALPETIPNEIVDKKKKIIDEVKRMEKEINIYYKNQKEFIERPSDIDKIIWNKVMYISNIENEIKNAKIQNEDNKTKQETALKIVDNALKEIRKYKEEFEILKNKMESLKEIKKKLIEFEEEQFQKFKNEIIALANEILVEFISEDIGMLKFDENKNLIIINSFYNDENKKDFQIKQRKYMDAKNYLSPGILRKIDFAFALAFFFLNRRVLIRPLNFLIIDGLNFLDLNDIKMIYESLAIENSDFKILIFSTDDPPNINEKFYEIKHISRNPLMRKLEEMQYVSRQSSLERFFK